MATSGIVNLAEITARLREMRTASQAVIDATVKDFKSRAPSWVAQEVVKEYNIKKGEVNPGRGQTGAGTIRAQGNTVASASLVYKGRVLTPIHFGMTPKVPKVGGSYTIKVQIKKGQKKVLGRNKKLTKKQRQNIGRNFTRQGTKNSPRSPVMLLSANGPYIPFQRKSQRRNDLEAVRTLSVPQMVSNEKVEKGIQEAINEKLGKRLDHHMNRLMR